MGLLFLRRHSGFFFANLTLADALTLLFSSLCCSERRAEGEAEQGQRDFGLAGSRETQRSDSGV